MTTLPDQVLLYLQGLMDDKPLYAIVDAAQDETLIDLLMLHDKNTTIQSLFEGETAQELAAVAPYLVKFDHPDHPLLSNLIQQGWGNHWSIFFDYPGDFSNARNQLRQCIRISDNEQNYLNFRFYDPRVFNQYIPTFDLSQLIAFYGAIGSYWLEDKKATGLLQFQMRDLKLDIQTVDLSAVSVNPATKSGIAEPISAANPSIAK